MALSAGGTRRQRGTVLPTARWLPWLVLAWLPAVHAQWAMEETGDDGVKVAVVRNEAGDEFRLWRNGDVIDARFTRHAGLVPMATDGCPSFRVDEHPPRVGHGGSGACTVEGLSATFLLGEVSGESVRSDALLEFINGSRMRFVYRLEGAGYEETQFTLQRSKQTISDVIGQGVDVVAE